VHPVVRVLALHEAQPTHHGPPLRIRHSHEAVQGVRFEAHVRVDPPQPVAVRRQELDDDLVPRRHDPVRTEPSRDALLQQLVVVGVPVL
jgi:hypothetical protein